MRFIALDVVFVSYKCHYNSSSSSSSTTIFRAHAGFILVHNFRVRPIKNNYLIEIMFI